MLTLEDFVLMQTILIVGLLLFLINLVKGEGKDLKTGGTGGRIYFHADVG